MEFRFGYTGREQDAETGLDYYRARYYDSAVGRFISEDPIGFGAGDANLYRYVGNSPTNYTDPSGLEAEIRWPLPNPLEIFIFTVKAAGEVLKQANPDGGRLNDGNVPPGATFKPTVTRSRDTFNPNLPGKAFPDFTQGDYNTGNKIPRPRFDPNDASKYKDFVVPQRTHTGHNDSRPNFDPNDYGNNPPVIVPEKLHPGNTRCKQEPLLFPPFLESTKQEGQFTEPTLPDKVIAQSGEVKIVHNYKSNDHGPGHVHVQGGGKETRILRNGEVYPGDPTPTRQQQKVINENLPAINRSIRKINKWLRYERLPNK